MALPTNAAVLAYYEAQPARNKTSKGFQRGTVERVAYIDWYTAQIPDGFTSPRGHVRTTRQEKRFQALYHLERVLMRQENIDSGRAAFDGEAIDPDLLEAGALGTIVVS